MRLSTISARSILLAGAAVLGALPLTAQAQEASDSAAEAPSAELSTAPAETPAAGDEAEQGDIVVVGSRIEGASTTGMLPVTSVGEDEIAATGAVSGDDLFREIPQAGDVDFNETRMSGNLTDSRGDVASINIRSLGTGYTLVLLNGRRMVKHPGAQAEELVRVQTVNINEVPVSGIRRVEILRDGAAALYGADAVAGVVNIVLDTKFRGLALSARYGGSEGTGLHTFTTSMKAGTELNEGRTRLNFFGSFTDRSALHASERDYAASADHRSRLVGTPFEGQTDFDNRANINSWAWLELGRNVTLRQNGVAITNSLGQFHVVPVANGCSGQTVLAGGNCLKTGLQSATTDRNLWFNENSQRTLIGAVNRYNAFALAEHDVSDTVTAFAEASYYHAQLNGLRNRIGFGQAALITIPSYAYWNPFGPVLLEDGTPNPNRLPGLSLTQVPAEGINVLLRAYNPIDAGPRPYTVKDQVYRLLGGFRGDLGDFKWETALLYSAARKTDTSHKEVSKTLFQQAIARRTPDAYNPFNGGDPLNPSEADGTPSADLTSFLVSNTRASDMTLAQWDARLTNSKIFAIPGGPVGFATGVEARRETFADDRGDRINGTIKFEDIFGRTDANSDSDLMGSQPLPKTSADRNVVAAYAELAVPLVAPSFEMPLIHALDLQLAGRVENYSDFGWVAKPKVAAAWEVVRGFLFRGSWSQSFHAPDLAQVSNSDSQASNGRSDRYRCEADLRAGRIDSFGRCAQTSTITEFRSNADLKAEDAETLSFGAVLRTRLPLGLGRVSLTGDYWRVSKRNAIGLLGAPNHIALDYLLRLRGSSNPNVIRDVVTPEDVLLFEGTGLTPAGRILEVRDSFMNLQPETISGLDFTLSYNTPRTAIGRFSLGVNVARLLDYHREPSPQAAEIIEAQKSGEISSDFLVPGAGDLLRQDGRPKWRASANLTWRKGPVTVGGSMRHVSSVYQTGATLPDATPWTVDPWTTYSGYVQYSFNKGALDGTRLRAGVRNITNEDPPLADAEFGYLGRLHNALGREWYAQISKTF